MKNKAAAIFLAIFSLCLASAEGNNPVHISVPLSVKGEWHALFFNSIDCTGDAVKGSLGKDFSFRTEWDKRTSPAPGITPGKWSLRTQATVIAGRKINANIIIGGDDGFRLTIDGNLLLDKWKAQPYTEASVDYQLTEGIHTFIIELFEKGGGAELGVYAEENSGDSIPPDSWKAEIFDSFEIEGKPVRVQDWGSEMLDFDWGYGSPTKATGNNRFSIRATRTVDVEEDGYYNFRITADDNIRLRIDGETLLDYWAEYEKYERWITPWLSKGTHSIELDFREDGGGASLALSWKRDSGAFGEKTVLSGRIRLPDRKSAERDLHITVYASSEALRRAYLARAVIEKGTAESAYSLDLPKGDQRYRVFYYLDDSLYALRGYIAPGIGTLANSDWTIAVDSSGLSDADLTLIVLGRISGEIRLPEGMKADRDINLEIHAYIAEHIDYFASSSAVIPKGSTGVSYELTPQISGVVPAYSVIVDHYEGGFVRHLYRSAKGSTRKWEASAPVKFEKGNAVKADFILIPDSSVPDLETSKALAKKEAASIATSLAGKNLTDFEKALVLYEWIARNISFSKVPEFFASESYSPVGPMTWKSGTCSGYAQTLAEMLTAAGIEAKTVSGGGHQWLQAKINGGWYFLESSRADRGKFASYSAFLAGEEQLSRLAGDEWDRKRYEKCPKAYAFKEPRDFPHLGSIPSKEVVRVFGSIMLPNGSAAAKGFMYTLHDSDFWFPQGAAESFFILPVERSKAKEPIALRIQSEAGGMFSVDGYYAGKKISKTIEGAAKIDLSRGDVTGLLIQLSE
jgi:hypothetical protein